MERQDKRADRRFRTWHVIAALLLIMLVLSHVSGSYKLKKRLETLRGEGYPLTLEELDRSYDIPEGAENAADVYLAAFAQQNKWDKEAMRDLPIIGRAPLPERTEPMDASSRRLVEKFLTDNGKTLSLLHEAVSIEHCRYPVDFAGTFENTSPWLQDIRTCLQMLGLEVLISCENQDGRKAMETIRANLALADSLEVPLMLYRFVRIGGRAMAYRSSERLINRIQLTDEQLGTLAEWVTMSDTSDGFKRVLAGERCIGLSVFQSPIRGIAARTGSGGGMLVVLVPWKLLGFHYRDELGYIDLMQDSIRAMDMPECERLAAFAAVHDNVYNGGRGGMLTRMIWPAHAHTLNIDYRHLAHSRVTQTGIVVERYRLAVGRLPLSLEDLVPVYMKTIPTDPFDGKSLKYRILQTGFVVYSVGEDKTDDGGTERGKGKRGPGGKPAPYDETFIVER